MDLTHLFPQPIPVDFNGRRLMVRPLKLRQLAELQGWLCAYVPSPAEAAARLAEGGLDEEGRRRLLVTAYDDAERWPLQVGSPEGDYLLDTPPGRLELLRVATGMMGRELREAAADATPADWARLDRACFGSDPLMMLARLIEPEAFATMAGDREPIDWCKLVLDAARDGGWTLDEVGEMTLGQLACWRSGGKREEPDMPPRAGETREEASERRMRYFDLDGEGGDGD